MIDNLVKENINLKKQIDYFHNENVEKNLVN